MLVTVISWVLRVRRFYLFTFLIMIGVFRAASNCKHQIFSSLTKTFKIKTKILNNVEEKTEHTFACVYKRYCLWGIKEDSYCLCQHRGWSSIDICFWHGKETGFFKSFPNKFFSCHLQTHFHLFMADMGGGLTSFKVIGRKLWLHLSKHFPLVKWLIELLDECILVNSTNRSLGSISSFPPRTGSTSVTSTAMFVKTRALESKEI